MLATYRSRLRRYVYRARDAALQSVSHSAETEAEACAREPVCVELDMP